ncbi:MAG TPA: ATP-binding cassette domain-containing protein [Gemmatimonadales bacterium]|nr:ATP-binding cassette domain-containing protein [Gemmatimonadales bacterium]
MNKARAFVFDAPFDSGDGIRWTEWNARVARRNVNSIVRIARCVVYPEFRGLGLGQVLVNHSFRFARRHWHVGGVRPYFVEITADMLKFVPFAARAGMVYIGLTEGNLSRIRKDLDYLIRNETRIARGEIIRVKNGKTLNDPQGILDLQLSYVRRVRDLRRTTRLSARALLARLDNIDRRVPLKTYELLQPVLRFPKPTYMRGLTATAHNFLVRRVQELGISEPEWLETVRVSPLSGPIVIRGLTVGFSRRVSLTQKTRAIQQAFGLSVSQLDSTVIKDFELTVPPGSIVLVWGASGSGKTVLLDLLARRGVPRKGMTVSGQVSVPRSARIGTFVPLPSTKPLIELYGGRDVYRAVQVLNTAGLCEAQLYLKRFKDLSRGQQYRALIARMIDGSANLWLADEFCATLDRVTANIVATNVRRHARKVGATLILACADLGGFVDALEPDIVVQLTNAWEYRVLHGKRFLQRLRSRGLRD